MTTTHRFQPGDKVRVGRSGTWAADLGLTANATYTVAHIDDFGQISLLAIGGYFHPSHFELVMRAVADEPTGQADHHEPGPLCSDECQPGLSEPSPESYCLKDGEGDWWAYDAPSSLWLCETHSGGLPRGEFEAGIESIEDSFGGIDGTPTAPAETYCLKDKDDDWWHSTDGENFRLWSWSDHSTGTRPLDHIVDLHGIDAEPIPAVAGVEVYEPGADERIIAWRRLADHPIFKDSYAEERPLIEAMVAKLDRIYVEGASPSVAPDTKGADAETAPEPAPTTCDGGYKCRAETHVDGCLVDDVEPEPLKKGDAVLAWARVVNPKPDSDGDLTLATPTGYGYDDTFYVRPDAIVRPAEGQVPPWVEEDSRPEEPTADYAIVRDGFRTYVRLPFGQIPGFASGKPWALVGVADTYLAWDEIEEPRVEVTR